MSTINFDIVSPAELMYSGSVDCIFAPTNTGEIGIYPNHTALLSILKPGEVRFEINNVQESIYISGGIIEVQPNMVTIFSDTAIRAHDLDEERVLEAKLRAEEELSDHASLQDITTVQLLLAESIAQLKIISSRKK